MSIVVTGADGFVGRHLVRRLEREGHRVVAVDRIAFAPAEARRVVGDFGDPAVLAEAMRDGCSAVIHLATIPGGAAEADPVEGRRVNIDASFALLDAARRAGGKPRVVFASSIAVFGDPLPAAGVDDATPLAPRMVYGAHKAMMELAVATMHRRGEIDAVTLRLPAIVARPKGPSGMKSAFLSDLFHALRAGDPFTCPVSEGATIWAQSLDCCVDNLAHGLVLESQRMPGTRAATLPALRVTMRELVAEIAAQCGASRGLVEYRPDPVIEAAFGSQPPLATPAADRAGFAHDGTVSALVSRALDTMEAAHVPA